jgi:hypothetical protein
LYLRRREGKKRKGEISTWFWYIWWHLLLLIPGEKSQEAGSQEIRRCFLAPLTYQRRTL